jgi:hypothetical protein
MKFFVGSLEKNVKDRLSNVGCAEAAFPTMLQHHPDIVVKTSPEQKRGLLCRLVRKLEFAYEHMDGPERWSEDPVPPQDAFFNKLRKQPLKDEHYEELMSLAEATTATSFEHTLITYLANDILQQADLLLAFRGEFKKITGLDPVHYLGIAGAAFSGMLRKTGAKFDLITTECMPGDKPKQLMKLVNDNIRGGLSCAFIPHALANNPDCEAYDATMPQVWLGSLDATNLYGWCMSRMLPVGGYVD